MERLMMIAVKDFTCWQFCSSPTLILPGDVILEIGKFKYTDGESNRAIDGRILYCKGRLMRVTHGFYRSVVQNYAVPL